MPDLIPPHGGLSEPVDRTVPAAEISDFIRQAAALKKVPISDADLSSLYRFGDGGLSPLTGPMDAVAFNRVLDGEVILHNGKPYAWTIPISFPVDRRWALRSTSAKPSLWSTARATSSARSRSATCSPGTRRSTSKAFMPRNASTIPAAAW